MATNYVHIANYQDAPRWSCTSKETMAQGSVIKITTGTVAGARYAAKVTAATDVQKQGQWGVALKVSADPLQVNKSSVSVDLGNRLVSISTGDAIIQAAAGAIIEFDASMLHSSLDPARSGATPTVGDSLGINTSSSTALFSTAATTSLTNVGTSINVAKVFATFGTKVLVQLVESA